MPILDTEEFVIKAKNSEGKYRIVGNLQQGDYGPRLSLINCKLLRDALAQAEDGKRVFLPVYLNDWNDREVVKQEEESTEE